MPTPVQSSIPHVDPVAQSGQREAMSLGLVEATKLTVRQAAKTAGISESQMRAEILKGKVPVIRICSKMLVLERDLENYLRGHYGIVQPLERANKPASRLPKEYAESDLIAPKRKSA